MNMGSNSIPIDWLSSLALDPTGPQFCIPNVPASFPAEIFHQIVSYLPLPRSHPSHLAKEALLSFSLTCRFFRDFFRNDVYSAITITSPGALTEIVEYLNGHTWPGQRTATKRLTLRWVQGACLTGDQSPIAAETPVSRYISSQQITLNLKILLRTHTSSLEELTLDFPGSGIHFQNAIIDSRGIPAHQHLRLKRLHISNGLCPPPPPASFLLCAISSLCAHSLEDLFIIGGCSYLGDSRMSTRELCPNKLHVPGVLMFRRFEKLQKLQRLHVKNLEGFDEECLSWMLSGEEMQSSHGRKGNRVLVLESNPDLTEAGISNALGSVKGGLEELNIMVLQKEALFSRSALAATEMTETTAENDTALSYMCDIYSITDTNQEDGNHSDSSFSTRASGSCSCSITSRSSSKTCHHHHPAEQSATFRVRLCDAARACRHLRHLDSRAQVICHSSLLSSSLDRNHRSGNATTRYPSPSTPLEDVAEDDNLSCKPTSGFPSFEHSPIINPEPTPSSSSHSLLTSSDSSSSTGREYRAPDTAPSDTPGSRPDFLAGAEQDGIARLRGGGREGKGLPKFADETLSRVMRVFGRLRGLWKPKKSGGREKERSKSRKRVSSETAEV